MCWRRKWFGKHTKSPSRCKFQRLNVSSSASLSCAQLQQRVRKKGSISMSTADNKALVRRVFEEVLNQGNLALIDEFYNPDYVEHTPSGPVHGTEAYKQYLM